MRSAHFTVMTDAGEKRGREVALRFEQMRAVFATLILREKVNIGVPLQVIAFRNRKEMNGYVPLWKGKPIEVAGFAQIGDDRHFIALDLSSAAGWPVVFHEYTHVLLNANFPRTAAWFDEGLAEYYSTLQVSGKDVWIGKAPEYASNLLTMPRLTTLEMLNVRHDDRTYNETGERRQVFYAQSWLMVHYLFDMSRLKETNDYFTLVSAKVPAVEAFQRAFGVDPRQFDKVLNEHLHSNHFHSLQMAVPPGINDLQFTVRMLSDAEAQTSLADLHLHSQDYVEQAQREFEDVLRADPNNANAHRGLGYAALRAGRLDTAAREFHLAASLNSQDPRVHYYSALLMQRQNRVDTADLAEVRQRLEAALALDPNYADALNLLAWSQAGAGNTKAAVASARRAVELSPRYEAYQFNLAQYLMADQQWDAARAVLQVLKSSENAMFASQAQQLLATIEMARESGAQARQARDNADRQMAFSSRSDSAESDDGANASVPPPTPAQIEYLKGTLLAVDCSSGQEAVLTVTVGGSTWKLRTEDRKKLVLIGADQFSCGWQNRKVSVNYRATGTQEGSLVSLELQ